MIAITEVKSTLENADREYDGSGSLYGRIDHHNARPCRMLQSLKVVEAGAVIASLLGIRTGAAVFEISQLGYSETGRVVEDSIGWYRGIAINTSARFGAIMSEFCRRYRDQVVDILDRIVASQTDAQSAEGGH